MEQKTDIGPSAPVLEMMEQGLTVMRMENENLQAMAIQKPRRIAQLAQAALEELRAFPKFASKAYYSIPYKDRSQGTEQTVLVEGPSIKAANALVRHWGNNSSGFRIAGGDEERILVQGVFIDFENGTRKTAEISVSRKARKRDGTYYTLPADRLNMAIQAGGSKAVRNAILNALPIGLVEGYFEEAKSLAARGGRLPAAQGSVNTGADDVAAIAEQMEACLARLETLGVERVEVSDYVTRHPELSNEESVCAHLIGLLNAIDEGAISVEEAFTVPDKAIAEPQRASAPAPAKTPAPDKKPLPSDRQRTQAKFDGATCPACNKRMNKGQWLWKNDGKWMHEAC